MTTETTCTPETKPSEPATAPPEATQLPAEPPPVATQLPAEPPPEATQLPAEPPPEPTQLPAEPPSRAVIEAIARLAHRVNNVYRFSLGEHIERWDDASPSTKRSVIAGVEARLSGRVRNPEDSHKGWLAFKQAEGWRHGPVKDEKLKTHPCFKPYHELPPEQRVKDALFIAAVDGAAGVVRARG